MPTEEDIRGFFHIFGICKEIHFCNCYIFRAVAHFYWQMFFCCIVAGEFCIIARQLEVVSSSSNIIEALFLALPVYSNVCLLFIFI